MSTRHFEFTIHAPTWKRLDDGQTWRGYFCIVPVTDLPQELTDYWIEGVNPRPHKRTRAAKDMEVTLREEPHKFLLKNRGILISADSVKHDPKTDQVTIVLTDPTLHGVADGGHTLRVIMAERDEETPAQVRLEVMVGFTDREELTELVAARNSHQPIKDITTFEHSGGFDVLKRAIKGQPYSPYIAYREHETQPLSVMDLVSILIAAHPPTDEYPIYTYSGSSKALDVYKLYESKYNALADQLPMLLEFHDDIYELIAESMKHQNGDLLEKKLGIRRDKEIELPYTGRQVSMHIPRAYIIPTISAFRDCADKPLALRKNRESLKKELKSLILDSGNSTQFGKTRANWVALRGTVKQ